MKDYDVAIWAHHGMFCAGPDFDTTFGLAHTVEKAAELYVAARAANGGSEDWLNKIEDKVIYDFMLENTDPKYVFFQMDVYWACMGRAYPVEYFRKYPGRFTLLHIKDHLELGESGMVGFDAIFNNAETAGMQDFIVELEGYTNGDWKESIKMCADYLLKSDFVKKSYSE